MKLHDKLILKAGTPIKGTELEKYKGTIGTCYDIREGTIGKLVSVRWSDGKVASKWYRAGIFEKVKVSVELLGEGLMYSLQGQTTIILYKDIKCIDESENIQGIHIPGITKAIKNWLGNTTKETL